MAKLNLDFYNSETDEIYSDGEIEKELLNYVKEDNYNWYKDGRWPIVYHLSHLRHNILNWYPFKEDCTILEIGAGCGALTGLFCERAKRVVAVELTKRRGEINFLRHNHYDNLEILVGDFQKVPSNWNFDYIIINGVLEYAAYMMKETEPYESFLKVASNYLSKDGKIFISIENRLGLKYFSGAREDHTGKFLSGINDYSAGENVKTFSKHELNTVITSAGLIPLKYYYPFPDYKFPIEIFTDSTVNSINPTSLNLALDMSRISLFNEDKMYKSFMDLGVMDVFSNSFLVEVAFSLDKYSNKIDYVKISANRNEKFQICTMIDEGNNKVYKKALTRQAEQHLNKMIDSSLYQYGDKGMQNVPCVKINNKEIMFPFLKLKNLEESLIEIFHNQGIEGFLNTLKPFRSLLYDTTEIFLQPDSMLFLELFGQASCKQMLHWKNNSNIDIVAGNVFLDEDGYKIIDYEWHFPCEIPQEYVLWRLIRQFSDSHIHDPNLPLDWYCDFVGINKDTEDCFSRWEIHFAEQFVGMVNLHNLAKDVLIIDLEAAAAHQLKERMLESTLFYDLGNGFTEQNYERVQAILSSDGVFNVKFDKGYLQESLRLRWDPLEGNACQIKIVNVETDGIAYGILPLNAETIKDKAVYEFSTYDPQFLIEGNFLNATYLKIFFVCTIIDWTQGYRNREEDIIQLQTASHQLINELNASTLQLESSHFELTQKSDELNQLQNQMGQIHEKLYQTKIELAEIQSEFEKSNEKLKEINTQIQQHRLKTILKILLFGRISRRRSDE